VPKTWNELNDSEKIEDLRRDVVRIFDVLNALINDVRNNHVRANAIETKVNEVSAEIARLADLLPKD
jgi:hypothetical protein